MTFADLKLRLKALVARRRAESELDEELKFHLAMEARKRERAGEPEADARHSARVAFGGVEQVRERCRDARGTVFIENLARDLRYAVRALSKSPGFTAIAVLSLSVGIGANTWLFSVIDRALLRDLPVASPKELVIVRWGGSGAPNLTCAGGAYTGNGSQFETNVFSWTTYSEMRARGGAVKDLFGFALFNTGVNVAANGMAQVSSGMLVSGNYFSSLGIRTVLGRPIKADDDSVDGVPAALIGYQYWQRSFGGSPEVLGKTIYINRRPHVIVGVAPRDFPSLAAELPQDGRAYVLLPLRARSYLEVSRTPGPVDWAAPDRLWVQIMGRLEPSSAAKARSELGATLEATLPDAKIAPHVILEPGASGPSHTARVKTVRGPMTIISVATALTLLIACANLAGLLLARGTRRRREISVRMSLGASRWRVVRQLLYESALLAAAGAAGGVVLARQGVKILIGVLASGKLSLPMLDDSLDWRILAFTGAAFTLATLLFGLAPALSATRIDLAEGMKEDGSNRGSGRSRGLTALVAVQAAAAVLLVTGALLLTRSLANLRELPLGFDPRNVVIFGVAPASSGYDEARSLEFYGRFTDHLERIPGVTGVTLMRNAPATGWTWSGPFYLYDGAAQQRNFTNFNFVGAEYFHVMGIPLIAGRSIDARDLSSSRRVAVLNEAAAKLFGPGSPIGKHFVPLKSGPEYEVIGVARNSVYSRLRETNPPTVYIPYNQPFGGNWMGIMTYAVRATASPRGLMPALGAALRQTDPMLPAVEMKTLEAQLDQHLAQERILAFLASLFGAVTLGLACMGVYGMTAYSVAARTREIGIRVALGASSAGVMRMVIRRAFLAVAVGLAIGGPPTYIVQQFLKSQLFGVDTADAAGVALCSVAVAAAAVLAAWLPARRALKIDPIRALRWE